jgi:hypothetical protein
MIALCEKERSLSEVETYKLGQNFLRIRTAYIRKFMGRIHKDYASDSQNPLFEVKLANWGKFSYHP